MVRRAVSCQPRRAWSGRSVPVVWYASFGSIGLLAEKKQPAADPTPAILAVMGPLSHDLDRDEVQPYFIWDIAVSLGEVRRLVAHSEPRTRALWKARVMREARYDDVWKVLALADILADWPLIQRHLGRSRRFWEFLLEGWREDGLLPG